jgi:sulfide:quinone oxidoreductase
VPAGILVVGGGVAGVHTANLLARRLPASAASIRLIDATGQHAFQPGQPSLALGETSPGRLVRDVRTLLHPRIELIIDEATRLDPTAGRLWMRREGSIGYDYAVLATGSRVDRDAVPGLADGVHDFYSVEGATRLREALRRFRGGVVVVGIAGMPYPCPPVPVEFALRVDALLRRLGVRELTEIHYLSPLRRALQIEAAADLVEPLFDRCGIEFHSFFNLEEIDNTRRRMFSLEGESVDYDLAVLVPPHRGAALIDDSGLGDPGGWIPTDPRTLRVRGYRRLFALGDATDLPISKAGSTAHFESDVVAEQVAAAIEGREPDPRRGTYAGRVVCFLRLGRRRATIIQVDADHPPQVSRPSRWWHLMRWGFERAYWSTMRRGWAFRAERFLPRIGA